MPKRLRRPTPEDRRSFKLQAVSVANEVRRHLTGDFAEVQALVDHHTIVFAVWQDRSEPDSVGYLIVKGQQLLREIIASGKSLEVAWTAIPCFCAEQAHALLQVAGEADLRH